VSLRARSFDRRRTLADFCSPSTAQGLRDGPHQDEHGSSRRRSFERQRRRLDSLPLPQPRRRVAGPSRLPSSSSFSDSPPNDMHDSSFIFVPDSPPFPNRHKRTLFLFSPSPLFPLCAFSRSPMGLERCLAIVLLDQAVLILPWRAPLDNL
jgi:hypothetical protein